MARIRGLFNCAGNFEVTKTAPLDSRTVIDTILELTQLSTWADESGKVWLYDGLVVAVKENNGLYVLSGQDVDPTAYSDESNWHRIDAAQIEIVDNLESTDNTKALAASLGKLLVEKIEDLKTSLSSALSYKGSVANFAALPTNATPGDVYNVVAANGTIPAGTNYAWNGTEWDSLGGAVDLSGYYTKDQVDTAISGFASTESLNALTQSVNQNSSDILVIKGDENTDGSIAKALKVSKDYTDTLLTNYVEKVEGSSLITAEKLALIDTNAQNISNLQETVEANTASINVIKGDADTAGSILNIVNNTINSTLTWTNIE